jgi:hypothetical protein
MGVLFLVAVVIAALAVIASGVWVAVALIHAICPPRAGRSELDAPRPADDKSAVRVADKSGD